MTALHATIIGSRGFIGQALEAYLMQHGWDVWSPTRTHRWPEVSRPLGHVFYCAGLTADYLKRPADTIQAHVCLLSTVLQSASYDSLVYLSSARVYDTLSPSTVVSEDMPLIVDPSSARQLYDLTKLTGEVICHALGRGRARVARLSCVYDGPGDSTGFLPELFRKVLGARLGTSVAIDSSPAYKRDYVHLADVLRALVDIAMRGQQSTYNVASGQNVSNAQLADYVSKATGRTVQFQKNQQVPEPPLISIDRLVAEFGWRPSEVGQQIQVNLERPT